MHRAPRSPMLACSPRANHAPMQKRAQALITARLLDTRPRSAAWGRCGGTGDVHRRRSRGSQCFSALRNRCGAATQNAECARKTTPTLPTPSCPRTHARTQEHAAPHTRTPSPTRARAPPHPSPSPLALLSGAVGRSTPLSSLRHAPARVLGPPPRGLEASPARSAHSSSKDEGGPGRFYAGAQQQG